MVGIRKWLISALSKSEFSDLQGRIEMTDKILLLGKRKRIILARNVSEKLD